MPINKALQGEKTLVELVYIWHLPQKGLSQVSQGNQKHNFGIAYITSMEHQFRRNGKNQQQAYYHSNNATS